MVETLYWIAAIGWMLAIFALIAWIWEREQKPVRCEWRNPPGPDSPAFPTCRASVDQIIAIDDGTATETIRLCTRHVRRLAPQFVELRWTGTYRAGPPTFAGAWRRLGRGARILIGTVRRELRKVTQ